MTVNDPPNRPLIMVSAGEASGDQHAAHALKELKKRGVDFDAFGMGAGDLAEIGVDIKVDCRELAVIGLVEVPDSVLHQPTSLGLAFKTRA